jgi:hypothetical protein
MATEFKPGAKVRMKRAVHEPINTPTRNGPTLRTFAVAAVIAGLMVASLYFSTIGRSVPALSNSPGVSTGQSPTPSPAR